MLKWNSDILVSAQKFWFPKFLNLKFRIYLYDHRNQELGRSNLFKIVKDNEVLKAYPLPLTILVRKKGKFDYFKLRSKNKIYVTGSYTDLILDRRDLTSNNIIIDEFDISVK